MRSDYEKFLSNLSVEMLTCRTRGHAWKVDSIDPDGRNSIWTDKCRNMCGVKRVQTLTYSGMIKASFYVYPDGYQFKDHGFPSTGDRAAARLELMRRFAR